jgi:D-ribose pyranose/furanose isomerase RbsD
MGHGDLLIVCDAGFPITSHIPRIDLAILPDLPDLETVLSAIAQDFIAEKVGYAAEMAENNPGLKRKVDTIRWRRFYHLSAPTDIIRTQHQGEIHRPDRRLRPVG